MGTYTGAFLAKGTLHAERRVLAKSANRPNEPMYAVHRAPRPAAKASRS